MINRKGVIPIVLVGWIALALVVIYLVLYIPIPSFKLVRSSIDLFIIFALWILIQVAVVSLYYYVAKYIIRAVQIFKKYILNFSVKFKKLLLT